MQRRILFVLALFVVMESSAYAYLDPGTGSIVLQALAAAAIALGLFWNRLIKAVKGLFRPKDALRK